MFSVTYRQLIKMWNLSFLVISVLALAVDPLFFYVPVVDGTRKFVDVDRKLLIVLCVLRSLVDLLSIIHIVIQFLTRRSGYLRSQLVIDLLASLPAPQLASLITIRNLNGSSPFLTTNLLKLIVLCQFVLQVIRLKLLYQKNTKVYRFIDEKAWAGDVFIVFIYLLASHVLGALWYLLAVESELRCWSIASQRHNCDIGIFFDAFLTRTLETRNLLPRWLNCLVWGLRSLSHPLGQHREASNYYEELYFAYFTRVIGLVLFALFVRNMKKYFPSYSNQWRRWMKKRQEARIAVGEDVGLARYKYL